MYIQSLFQRTIVLSGLSPAFSKHQTHTSNFFYYPHQHGERKSRDRQSRWYELLVLEEGYTNGPQKERSLRIILTIAAKYDLEIGQLDVISAFLNGLIDRIVYLRQPDGFALDTRRTIQVSQAHYAKQIIESYGMQQCNPVLTPMELKEIVHNTGTCTQEDKTLFQRMVGSVLYLANGTRPDISYAVTRLAQFASNPSEQHMLAIKRVLRYIKGTMEAKLLLATSNSNLIGYFDSSWLDNPRDRRSTYGLAILWNGSLLLWKSKIHNDHNVDM